MLELPLASLVAISLAALPLQESSPRSASPPDSTDEQMMVEADLLAAYGMWLDDVEQLRVVGDLEQAREFLAELVESELHVALEAASDKTALKAFWRLDTVAGSLSVLEVQLLAREETVGRLSMTLSADDSDLLLAMQSLAKTRYELGDLEGALELDEYVHAALTRRLPADHRELLGAKMNLAVTRNRLGNSEGALQMLEHVHAARTRLLPADDPGLLRVKTNLAATRYELRDLEGALELVEHVHAARTRQLSADHPALLRAKKNLAQLRGELGDLEGALELYEQVRAAWTRLLPEDHVALLDVKTKLGVLRLRLGDHEGALELSEYVHAARTRLLPADHSLLLIAKENLAISRTQLGDVEGALELLEYVHAAYRRLLPADHHVLLNANSNLALARKELGDLDGALELARSNADGVVGFSLHALTGSSRERRVTARSAVDQLARGRIWYRSRDVPAAVLNSYFAGFETARHVASARLAADISGMSSGENSAGIDRAHDQVLAANCAIDAHIARGPSLPERQDGQDESAWKALCEEAQAAWNRKLAQRSLERDAKEKAFLKALGGARSFVTRIESDAVADALSEGDAAIGIHKIKCWDDGANEPQRTNDGEHYIAYVLRVDGHLSEVDLGPADLIEARVLEWRTSIDAAVLRRGSAPGLRSGLGSVGAGASTGSASAIEPGRRLRRVLLDPLLEAAAAAPTSRIYICLDDALHSIPFDALPLDADFAGSETSETDTPRVGDLYDIRYELSFARLLAPGSAPDGAPSLLVVGGVDFDGLTEGSAETVVVTFDRPLEVLSTDAERLGEWGSWDPIDGTRSEANSIVETAKHELEIDAERLEGESVTESRLREAVAGKRYVHLATHGWFLPENVRSMLDSAPEGQRSDILGTEFTVTGFTPMALCGLVMSGANSAESREELSARLLTALELSSFDLWDCELAVLSACETNVGVARAGQGIQSLLTALHQAGARTSVTSLWRVDDDATSELMQAFYVNLWRRGMGKADALWEAKCKLRRAGAPERAWAGWVLVGDPD